MLPPELIRALEALDPTRKLLLGLDFDGTLAPLASKPERARLSMGTRRLLSELADQRGAHVAVISGRALNDVRRRVGLDGLHYAGNHGLEISGPRLRWAHPSAARSRNELERLVARLRREIVVDGVFVEHKELSASVHYRLAAPGQRESARRRLSRILRAAARRFRISLGHKVWEIRPRTGWDKGMALLQIARRLGGAPHLLAVGDDRSDEEGFRTLGPKALRVRVGGTGRTNADFRVRGPEDVRLLLERVLVLFS